MADKFGQSSRIDHAGDINIHSPTMSEERRSSLIDRMAMAAISQQLLENFSEDTDDETKILDKEVSSRYEDEMESDGGGDDEEGVLKKAFNTELDAAENDYSEDISTSQPDYGYEDMDNYKTPELIFVEETPSNVGAVEPARQSFSLRNRRTSYRSESDGTFHSAPARTQQDPMSRLGYESPGSSESKYRRPMSVAVPNAAGAVSSMRMARRGTSSRIVNSFTGIDEGEAQSAPFSGSSLLFGRLSSLGSRKNSSQDLMTSFDTAIERLKKNSKSEWENVAAAVAIVQESEKRPTSTSTRHNQFAVGDTVLVYLTLLNVTNGEDAKDAFTVSAVNKFGYPEGEGRTEDEKKGPYLYVLATVKQLHFEEDDRYYTVIRADTGSEQRADSGWMEPLTNLEGIEAAARAAKKTFRSVSNDQDELMDESGYFQDVIGFLYDFALWPVYFVHNSILPGYRKIRSRAKLRVAQMIYGDSPFACRIQINGIHFLVLCSIIFLFLEVANLAFFPATYNTEVSIVGTIVWAILVLELILEVIIRPIDYSKLMESDKAFAPSTARHINTFHIFFEGLALATFLPEFWCITDQDGVYSGNAMFSRVRSSLDAILGENEADILKGRFHLGLTALRFFGVVRHWKQMWINKTFHAIDTVTIEPNKYTPTQASLSRADSEQFQSSGIARLTSNERRIQENADGNESHHGHNEDNMYGSKSKGASSEEEQRLKNAATIGTALMVVNSQRALLLLTAIVVVLPLLLSINVTNRVAPNLVELLQGNNVQANSTNDCDYLKSAVDSWLNLAVTPQPATFVSTQEEIFVLWAQLLPKRCPWQNDDGVITVCSESLEKSRQTACETWQKTASLLGDESITLHSTTGEALDDVKVDFANELHIRDGGIRLFKKQDMILTNYTVIVFYNENPTIALANTSLFFLLLLILTLGLYSLQALRRDAIRLVLDPLQRMLKIVLQYAENPLSQTFVKSSGSKGDSGYDEPDKDTEEIGNFETEQLINAITKIADLLRKCWGVAGAGIISSNLARTNDGKTVLFNPTVPGKQVYALFGFVSINGFSDQLRRLNDDVMILINDVAKVVHDEVYRWALGDHGQCNKNLGAAFLMVFRIGDFSEVHKKKQEAEKEFWQVRLRKLNDRQVNKLRKRRLSTAVRAGRRGKRSNGDGQINLASLPGIQGFTDRALLGMLKSFAGIHRDKNVCRWQNDFRLSDGVGTYNVDIIYGMDAGWAVEGAVGSEYKIDATYLSPHVNMAFRMMSATKQYGVTILLSKAVEELLSRNCRKKLRNLDTVYVKGSKVKQDIFTFDARHQGADFFLIERTPTQADIDAEFYTPNIWDEDQDLKAMRQHVSEEFIELFNQGVKEYLAGNWKEAYDLLRNADNNMIEFIVDEGYIDIDLNEYVGDIYDQNCQTEDTIQLRQNLGDGACKVLMSYMETYNLTAPPDWDGVRKLSNK